MKKEQIDVKNTNIEIVEENGVVSIKIKSEDAIVYMNDEIIWSIGNEKEEFKNIPKKLHSYILNFGSDYTEYDEKKKETVVDTYFKGESLSLYIPKNQNKHMYCRFDFITSIEEVMDYILSIMDEEEAKPIQAELTKRLQTIKDVVSSKGYKIGISHDMGEWAYAWWDIILKASEWSEENIIEIMNEIISFNQYIRRIRDEYNF